MFILSENSTHFHISVQCLILGPEVLSMRMNLIKVETLLFYKMSTILFYTVPLLLHRQSLDL